MRLITPGEHRPDKEANHLSDAWNRIVDGQDPLESSELLDLVLELQTSEDHIQPRPQFTLGLKEKIMDMALTAPIAGAHIPVPQAPRPARNLRPISRAIPSGSSGAGPSAWSRWLTLAAVALVALTSSLVAYKGGFLGGSGGNDNGTYVAAPFLNPEGTPVMGTPEAGVSTPTPCLSPNTMCASNPGFAAGAAFDKIEASEVILQSFEVAGSTTVSFSAPLEPVSGVAVDVVMAGAYQATFTEPVVVQRSNLAETSSGNAYEYPGAGTIVELSTGDTVSYPIGSKRSVTNPFSATMLAVKTASLFTGDVSSANLAVTGAVNFRDNGAGATDLTPEVIELLAAGNNRIEFTYLTIYDTDTFPPANSVSKYLLGPVDGPRGDNVRQGFVLWLSTPQG